VPASSSCDMSTSLIRSLPFDRSPSRAFSRPPHPETAIPAASDSSASAFPGLSAPVSPSNFFESTSSFPRLVTDDSSADGRLPLTAMVGIIAGALLAIIVAAVLICLSLRHPLSDTDGASSSTPVPSEMDITSSLSGEEFICTQENAVDTADAFSQGSLFESFSKE
jgi:hypothetical protein